MANRSDRFIATAMLLLLSSACDRGEEPSPPDAGEVTAVVPSGPGGAAQPGVNRAELQAKASRALSVILNDPPSARYANVRAGSAGAVCGDVDAKGPEGKHVGMRPFVVTPEGVAVVSITPTVALDDPEDIFPDFYIRWCASPQELARLAPLMARRQANPSPLPTFPDVPIEVPAGVPVATPPGQDTPQAGAASEQPKSARPGFDDSFFNVVVRPAEPAKAGE